MDDDGPTRFHHRGAERARTITLQRRLPVVTGRERNVEGGAGEVTRNPRLRRLRGPGTVGLDDEDNETYRWRQGSPGSQNLGAAEIGPAKTMTSQPLVVA